MKKFPYYSLKLVKLYCTPHIIAKKESKSDMGLPMGMHKCAKGHLTNFGLLMALVTGDMCSYWTMSGSFS